jgi:hypothetical protein
MPDLRVKVFIHSEAEAWELMYWMCATARAYHTVL